MIRLFLKIKTFGILMLVITFTSTFLVFPTFAENVGISLNYGINKVAKSGMELPIELTIENKDMQEFRGYVALNVYESNRSVFVYRIDVNIGARSSSTYYRTISITNLFNTVGINLYNWKEELVANERTNIDLTFYNDRLIIGVISSDYNSLSYLDNIILTNSSVQTKIVPISIDKIQSNSRYLDTVDMLLISDYDFSGAQYVDDAINNLVRSGKPVFIGLSKNDSFNKLPASLRFEYNDEIGGNMGERKFNIDGGIVVITPFSFIDFGKTKDAGNKFIELLEENVDESWILKLNNGDSSYLNNDYYNISNLLNIIDKMKLPDIFIISVLLLFYVSFLTIIIYVFLRNINKREQYGRYAAFFSIIYTIVMVVFGYSVMKKNTFLTYLSIVNINDANTKETAFLNFRTSEGGNYSFDTGKNIKINPILMNNKEPIMSLNFMNSSEIKSTIFTEDDERKYINVENAKDFDSNVFIYENSNYLNDIYNLDCSYQRFDGTVSGRITNKMNLTIKDAHILLFGKIIKIGDIEPSHSISLSRATNIGAPIGNNIMLSDIISDESNRNIVKYYLDENVFGYYDYGLLFGFIDNNGTIDINSKDVGDVYGRTLIVTKINRDQNLIFDDYCSLKYPVNNVEGYYSHETNTINGDTDVVNEYTFETVGKISKIYFEGIDSYDHGSLESYVPFYGEILAYNYHNNTYEEIVNNTIDIDTLDNYLMPNNRIIVKFNPLSRDPLYRKISVPIMRAIAEK